MNVFSWLYSTDVRHVNINRAYLLCFSNTDFLILPVQWIIRNHLEPVCHYDVQTVLKLLFFCRDVKFDEVCWYCKNWSLFMFFFCYFIHNTWILLIQFAYALATKQFTAQRSLFTDFHSLWEKLSVRFFSVLFLLTCTHLDLKATMSNC